MALCRGNEQQAESQKLTAPEVRATVGDQNRDQIEFSGTSTIQGSASRTTNTNTLSGTPAIGNLTDLGGNHYEDEDGNLNQQWDGTTYPAYWANVGAQR